VRILQLRLLYPAIHFVLQQFGDRVNMAVGQLIYLLTYARIPDVVLTNLGSKLLLNVKVLTWFCRFLT